MNKNQRNNNILAAVMAVVLISLTCLVSNADYNHTKVAQMEEDVYETVLRQLAVSGNTEPSEAEIVEWWEKHHEGR